MFQALSTWWTKKGAISGRPRRNQIEKLSEIAECAIHQMAVLHPLRLQLNILTNDGCQAVGKIGREHAFLRTACPAQGYVVLGHGAAPDPILVIEPDGKDC